MKVAAGQVSHQATSLVEFLLTVLSKAEDGKKLANLDTLKKKSGVTEKDWENFLLYTNQTLANCGNFRSFGDTKFIPRIAAEEFKKIVESSENHEAALKSFNALSQHIYSLEPETELLIGFPGDGYVSGYYSNNIKKEDVVFTNEFLISQNLIELNTRLNKSVKDNVNHYEIKIASAEITHEPKTYDYKGTKITVVYGDFQKEMKDIADNMEKAGEFSANEHQRKMCEEYVKSFRTGCMQAHKESQKHWIRGKFEFNHLLKIICFLDLQPHVESNIGFVETYRDPSGVRAEYEGFVAM
ncbi:hypothetical protein HK099_007922, partial [Clydaea vesicula]